MSEAWSKLRAQHQAIADRIAAGKTQPKVMQIPVVDPEHVAVRPQLETPAFTFVAAIRDLPRAQQVEIVAGVVAALGLAAELDGAIANALRGSR